VNFDSHYDGPVRTAVLLINALTPGQDRGRDYSPPEGEELRAAATEALRSASEALEDMPLVTQNEAAEFVVVAGRLRTVVVDVAGGELDAAAREINRQLRDTNAQPHLARHEGQPWWHLHYAGARGGVVNEWAGACAGAVAVVLGSDARTRLGICTAPRCDRVYVDVSRNGTRRFCSTACQNRVKAATFRAGIRSD
jgi:predicted RNA-binding Zn ribbon-like protein